MHGTTAVRTWPLAAARAGFIALRDRAAAVGAAPVPAATRRRPPAAKRRIKVTPFPPSVQIDTNRRRRRRGRQRQASTANVTSAVIRLDSDRDFESFKDAVKTAPWIVGLVFLVVGSIFLTPVILLIGIVWYKLRKTRMQNEALLKLAEKGVMPPAQAVDAVASGVMPEVDRRRRSRQRAVKRRTSRRSQRGGGSSGPTCARAILLGAFGLSFTMYSHDRERIRQLDGTHAAVRGHGIHRALVVRGSPPRPARLTLGGPG